MYTQCNMYNGQFFYVNVEMNIHLLSWCKLVFSSSPLESHLAAGPQFCWFESYPIMNRHLRKIHKHAKKCITICPIIGIYWNRVSCNTTSWPWGFEMFWISLEGSFLGRVLLAYCSQVRSRLGHGHSMAIRPTLDESTFVPPWYVFLTGPFSTACWFGTFEKFSIYWEFHHPNWQAYFSEGSVNHQPVYSYVYNKLDKLPEATRWLCWNNGKSHTSDATAGGQAAETALVFVHPLCRCPLTRSWYRLCCGCRWPSWLDD